MKKWIVLIFAIAVLGGNAARAQEIAGTWQGTLKTNDGEYRIVLAISRTASGDRAGTAYVVDADGQPLHKPVPMRIAHDGSVIRVSIASDEGGFEGRLSEDGESIVGDYTEGDSVPLSFVRATGATAWKVEGMPTFTSAPNGSAHSAIQQAMVEALGGTSSASASTLKPGAEILSDTMGVDFSGYMQRLHQDIQRNWDPLIPAKVQKPNLKKGVVGIRFTILPDGRIGSMKLETTSGDVDLDKAAWYAITSEGQYPALPQAFHGPQLELRVGFFYNTTVQPPKANTAGPLH